LHINGNLTATVITNVEVNFLNIFSIGEYHQYIDQVKRNIIVMFSATSTW